MKSVVFAAGSGRPGDLVDDRANAGRFRASRLGENLCVDLFSECLAALVNGYQEALFSGCEDAVLVFGL